MFQGYPDQKIPFICSAVWKMAPSHQVVSEGDLFQVARPVLSMGHSIAEPLAASAAIQWDALHPVAVKPATSFPQCPSRSDRQCAWSLSVKEGSNRQGITVSLLRAYCEPIVSILWAYCEHIRSYSSILSLFSIPSFQTSVCSFVLTMELWVGIRVQSYSPPVCRTWRCRGMKTSRKSGDALWALRICASAHLRIPLPLSLSLSLCIFPVHMQLHKFGIKYYIEVLCPIHEHQQSSYNTVLLTIIMNINHIIRIIFNIKSCINAILWSINYPQMERVCSFQMPFPVQPRCSLATWKATEIDDWNYGGDAFGMTLTPSYQAKPHTQPAATPDGCVEMLPGWFGYCLVLSSWKARPLLTFGLAVVAEQRKPKPWNHNCPETRLYE